MNLKGAQRLSLNHLYTIGPRTWNKAGDNLMLPLHSCRWVVGQPNQWQSDGQDSTAINSDKVAQVARKSLNSASLLMVCLIIPYRLRWYFVLPLSKNPLVHSCVLDNLEITFLHCSNFPFASPYNNLANHVVRASISAGKFCNIVPLGAILWDKNSWVRLWKVHG